MQHFKHPERLLVEYSAFIEINKDKQGNEIIDLLHSTPNNPLEIVYPFPEITVFDWDGFNETYR